MVIARPAIVRMHEMVAATEGRDIAAIREADGEAVDEGEGMGINEGPQPRDDSALLAQGQQHTIGIPTSASLLMAPDGLSSGERSLAQIRRMELSAIDMAIHGTGSSHEPLSMAAGGSSNDGPPQQDAQQHQQQQPHSTAPNRSSGHLPQVPFLTRPGDSTPLNEFTQNRDIITGSFPDLFLLGVGVPTDASVNAAWRKGLMRHYTRKFENKELQFLFHNQASRHAAAQVVAKRVKSHPSAVAKASALLNDPDFDRRLKEAKENPLGSEAQRIMKEVHPILQGLGRMVPHSPAERAHVVTQVYASQQRYGDVATFFTFSPDDTNNLTTIRLCFDLSSNTSFPAQSSIPLRAGSKTFKEVLVEGYEEEDGTGSFVLKLPLTQRQKTSLIAQNPTAGR